jgi:hypothetical protein
MAALRVFGDEVLAAPQHGCEGAYARDNVARLKAQKILEGRVPSIVNDIDAYWERIDKDLDGFIENVVRPYKAMANLGTCLIAGLRSLPR